MKNISELKLETNNMDKDISYIRNIFLSAEKDYFNKIIEDVKIKELIEYCNTFPAELLYELANTLINDVEMGLVSDDMMGIAERKLIILLAAIKDSEKKYDKKVILNSNDFNSSKKFR